MTVSRQTEAANENTSRLNRTTADIEPTQMLASRYFRTRLFQVEPKLQRAKTIVILRRPSGVVTRLQSKQLFKA